MSRLTSDYHALLSRARGVDWGRNPLARRHEPILTQKGAMLVSLALLGAGAVAFYVLAPDIKRYLKIRNM